MQLTIHTDRLSDGGVRGYFLEVPSVFFRGATEKEVVERLEAIRHALSSPYVHVNRIERDGSVVLTIERPHHTLSEAVHVFRSTKKKETEVSFS